MKQPTTATALVLATALILPQTAWSEVSYGSGYSGDYENNYNNYANTYADVEGFLGGGIGYYRIDDQNFLDEDEEFEDERLSWKVFTGIDLGRVLAVELAYIDFGELTEGPASLDATGWTIAGIFALPITENFAPYGKAGQLFWDADFTVDPVTTSADGNEFFFGVGGRFALNEHADIRLEYERFTMDDTDVDLASLNLQFRF